MKIDKIDSPVYIGRLGETGVQTIDFDVSDWLAFWVGGNFIVKFKQSYTDAAINLRPDQYRVLDGILTIDVRKNMTAKAGRAALGVELIVGGDVKKRSEIIQLVIADSVGNIPEEQSDEIIDWIEGATIVIGEAQTATVNANEATRIANEQELLREGAESDRRRDETARNDAEVIRIAAENTRNNRYETAEDDRDGLYDDAEGARDDLYGLAETARDGLYNTAENARGGQYTTAENARDSTFGIAEGSRVNAFNLAESGRASAEISRSTAEGLRQTAETNRIALHSKWSNPEAIATTLAPGSPATAEVVIGADKVTLNIGIPEGIRGNGIVSTVRTAGTGLAGSTDTYTITYDDDTTSTFTVYNGQDGDKMLPPLIKQYIIRWDKINSQCVRMGDAATITTDITNFAHRGAVNPSYSNPFDNLYPWRDRKLCKVDRAVYQTLTPESSILDCVTMWEGEPGFALDGSGGFDGVYTPEFWGRQWEDGGYVYYGVADGPVPGWVHYPATIGGRYFGSKDASNKMTSIANAIPWRTDAMSVLKASAVSQGMTIDDIWTWSADSLLMIVEYATLNSQTAVGAGCDGLYRQSAEKVGADAAIGATLIKLPNAFVAACVAGAVIGLGTSDGGEQTAITRFISSADLDGADPLAATHKGVTIPALTANITTATFASIHGCFNAPDTDIGSKSGYIGTASKSNAYYRGRIAHANYWRYVLGAYRQKDTNKIWVAKSRQEAAAYDALNVAVHVDTGKVLATASGYIAALHFVEGKPAMPFASETGGTASDANPVGDYLYMPAIGTADTILRAGVHAPYGAVAGRFCAAWSGSASYGFWSISALPFLLNP